MNKVIDEKWTIAQVLSAYPETRETFLDWGIMCLECPSATMESLELGTRLHGIETQSFIDALNKKVNEKNS